MLGARARPGDAARVSRRPRSIVLDLPESRLAGAGRVYIYRESAGMNAPHRPAKHAWLALFAAAALCAAVFAPPLAAQGRFAPLGGITPPPPPKPELRGCFLLSDANGNELRRQPSSGCDRRVAPAATFEIAAALAALDASIVRGTGTGFGQTLDSALAYSSPEYFRAIDQQMGSVRMGEYLNRFDYGNADTSSGGEYWNGGSLQISPNEQMRFLLRLFDGRLPVSRQAALTVRESLEQPPGVLVSPRGVVLTGQMRSGAPNMSKGGAVQVGDEAVRWQIGMIASGTRSYVFVSCVTGPADLPEGAAMALATSELRKAGVL